MYQFRMSMSGDCPRAISAYILGKKGKEIPSWLEQTAEEGKWHEERLINELSQGQVEIPAIGKEPVQIIERQREYDYNDAKYALQITGHSDAVARLINPHYLLPDKFVVEIKSKSRYEYSRWMRDKFSGFMNEFTQISCYSEMEGNCPVLFIVKNRDTGAKSVNIIKPEMLIPFNDILSNHIEITEYLAENELFPKEPDFNTEECRRCQYMNQCLVVSPDLDSLSDEELENARQNYNKGKELEEQAATYIDSARTIFKKQLNLLGMNKFRFKNLSISLSNVKRELIDKEIMKQILSQEDLTRIIKTEESERLYIRNLTK